MFSISFSFCLLLSYRIQLLLETLLHIFIKPPTTHMIIAHALPCNSAPALKLKIFIIYILFQVQLLKNVVLNGYIFEKYLFIFIEYKL